MHLSDFIHALDHHAYFIHSFKDSVDHLKEFLKDKFHIHHEQNPDFFHEKFEVFGIDDSRRIRENHISKSFIQGGKRIFVIETSNMTHEAQNSLLKIFEEPNEDSHFFLIMPSPHVLLPTLRSRLFIIQNVSDRENTGSFDDIEDFLKLSKKEKVDFVDDIAKDYSDDKITKNDVQEFLARLEYVLYKNGLEKNKKGLQAILKVRGYLNDRSPSIKQLLEYIALNL